MTGPPTPDLITPPGKPVVTASEAVTGASSLAPKSEVVRYLVVGVWNTAFGYLLYSALVWAFSHFLPHRYLPLTVVIAAVTAKPIAITMAFFCYKHFVFRTQGNYLQEWLRCFAVYGIGMLPELIALPVLTHFFLRFPSTHNPAPYLAGAIVTGATVILSYFGHKKFSFRK